MRLAKTTLRMLLQTLTLPQAARHSPSVLAAMQ
jgi:hypothetical protein